MVSLKILAPFLVLVSSFKNFTLNSYPIVEIQRSREDEPKEGREVMLLKISIWQRIVKHFENLWHQGMMMVAISYFISRIWQFCD